MAGDLSSPAPPADSSRVEDFAAPADLAAAHPSVDLASAIDLGANDSGPASGAELLISQVRSRGAGGASDELIELYNPGPSSVRLDGNWTVEGRSTTSSSFTARWTGAGQVLLAHGHLLLTGSGYTQQPAGDAALSGITDASAIRLRRGSATVDTVCYAFDSTTRSALTADSSYGCPGSPADNSPHDNTNSTASDIDLSIERKAGGAGGNAVDTHDNAANFIRDIPAVPRNLGSPAAP